MSDNPFTHTYAANRYARVGWRGKYARDERRHIASVRAYNRRNATEAHATNRAETVACVIAWINATFADPAYGRVIEDLPTGARAEESMCPIANAVAQLLDVEAAEVAGEAVAVRDATSLLYGEEWEMPQCARRFVRLFDAGYFPQYEDPMYGDDDYHEED